MTPEEKRQHEEKMKKAIEFLTKELRKIHTGRASTTLLEEVHVDYYGTLTPLNQVATLNVPEPRLITIQPWDVSILGEIKKAISKSDIGLNPTDDGKIIRLPIPPLSEERRREILKKVKQIGEEAKVAVRQIRRDINEHLKKEEKDKRLSETELKVSEAEVQKLTDKYIQKVDETLHVKEQEIIQL